jgi:hypothetical protein
MLSRFRQALASLLHAAAARLGPISVRITDDNTGWVSHTGRPHDRDYGEIQKLYLDALEAWRKNPFAKRIVDIITDYAIGDGITLSAKGSIEKFLNEWWNHPKNLMDIRLPDLCDELTRAGDLFVTLHTNPYDGMSYIRVVPKDLIVAIRSQNNDWETELEFDEAQPMGDTITWMSPDHPQAATADRIMIHYSINRPAGALLGESDLATMLIWLQRYSRMLEDRVRLNWAVRAFLWLVTVPSNKVAQKRIDYSTPPEAGSIIVKDEQEEWDVKAPNLHASDASHDLRAVRMMIDAGSGQPPHWRGEGESLNLATARAMTDPAIRHLKRRQRYITHLLTDLAHHAYQRAHLRNPSKYKTPPNRAAIIPNLPDINRDDDPQLATAAKDIADALDKLQQQLPGRSTILQRLILRLTLKFAGEPQDEDVLDSIINEVQASNQPAPAANDSALNQAPVAVTNGHHGRNPYLDQ